MLVCVCLFGRPHVYVCVISCMRVCACMSVCVPSCVREFVCSCLRVRV